LAQSIISAINILLMRKPRATEMAQKKIKSNVQKATFDLGALSEMNLKLDANLR